MKVRWYLISSGKLREQPDPGGWPGRDPGQAGDSWFDIEEAEQEELRQFLAHLDLHPVMLGHCLDRANTPGVISFGRAVLLEFPAASDLGAADPSYLTILLQATVLVTVRHGPMPTLNNLVTNLCSEQAPDLSHLVQIIYLILDDLTDLTVRAETGVRDRVLHMAKTMSDNPGSMKASDLTRLRWQVDRLISLIEDQLYCVTGLNASDDDSLQEPHRKAYIQDLLSEVQIAQNGIYRLEARVKDLYDSYQMEGNSRVEKRLRILTIVSAITLPFSLIAGLLGMNVGGLPGTQNPDGFIIVIGLMGAIAAAELWYFKHKGWLD